MQNPYTPPSPAVNSTNEDGFASSTNWSGHNFVVTGEYFPAFFPLLAAIYLQVDGSETQTSTKIAVKERFEIPFTHEDQPNFVTLESGIPLKHVNYKLTVDGEWIAEGKIVIHRWLPAILVNCLLVALGAIATVLTLIYISFQAGI